MVIQFLGKPAVEIPEIDQFAGSIDLGLESILTHVQHGRRINNVPVGAGQQFGHLEKNLGPFIERCSGPICPSIFGGADGLGNLCWASLVKPGQNMAVVVGHNTGACITSADFRTADKQWNFNFLGTEFFELSLQAGSFW